jgi:hypothetical protein
MVWLSITAGRDMPQMNSFCFGWLGIRGFGRDFFNDVFGGGFFEGFWRVFVEAVGGEGEGVVLDLDDGGDDLADGIFVGWKDIDDGGVELLGVRAGGECECGLMPVGAGAIEEGVVGDGDGAFASGAFAFPMALKVIQFDDRASWEGLGGGEDE